MGNRKEYFFRDIPEIKEEEAEELLLAKKGSEGGLKGLAIQATLGALNPLKSGPFQEYVNNVGNKTKSLPP